ncbi:hypothetical protein DPMN_147196 [Dreissena polymorpha]|uniref:Uncharacterized protein n=1 Tax=Dreissena polymorpha TaxID=45954 RepID=A0A9D4FA36_DREPO|nr:hypothetical protein DPMN_147196 [Dreissena polymorpha]
MDEVKITFRILITTDSKGTAMSPLEGVKKSIGTISMDNGTHEINFHLPEVRQSLCFLQVMWKACLLLVHPIQNDRQVSGRAKLCLLRMLIVLLAFLAKRTKLT